MKDNELERNENFQIKLYEPSGGARIGRVNRTTITIAEVFGKI